MRTRVISSVFVELFEFGIRIGNTVISIIILLHFN